MDATYAQQVVGHLCIVGGVFVEDRFRPRGEFLVDPSFSILGAHFVLG